jgi:hypothetical protein
MIHYSYVTNKKLYLSTVVMFEKNLLSFGFYLHVQIHFSPFITYLFKRYFIKLSRSS